MNTRVFRFVLSLAVFTLSATVGHAATRARFTGETVLNDPPVRIAAGQAHTCQVSEDSSLLCWGANNANQLDYVNGNNQPLPVIAVNSVSGVAVTAGFLHTCALGEDGKIQCWGSNQFGQHGAGTTTGSIPERVSGISNAVAISAGSDHTCALLADGTAKCWGSNSAGQLGDNSQTTRTMPVAVQGLSNAIAINAGGNHTCALIAGGTVRCWGRNASGELGDGTTTMRLTPVAVTGLSNTVAISSGSGHTCALIADGTARCWGANTFGAIGNNSTAQQLSPAPVLGLTNAVGISAGGLHTCALLADGTARCWGWNHDSEIGDGTATDRHTSVAVLNLTNAVAIVAGGFHTCAMLADGTSRCWGSGASGQLGNGGFATSVGPAAVANVSGGFGARDVAAGRNHTCVVRANGTAACWGSDSSGQIGDGATGVNRTSPVAVPGLTNVVAIAGGEGHTCALLASGTVRCWGLNSSGEIGDGTNTTRPSPVAVIGLTSVVAIATGGDLGASHTCALIADGTVRCWGANNNGQLGDNTTATRLSPVMVQGVGNAVAIATGAFHTCGLLSTGAARCWGANNSGQLGDGTTTPHVTAVPVLGLTNAVSIASGDQHNCVLMVDGTARCWGANLLGQLGNGGNISPQPLPNPVATLIGAVAIAGGSGHSCAVRFDSIAFCWGSNTLKELGDGSTNSSTVPVGVRATPNSAVLTRVLTITTGRHHSCALLSTGGVTCWGDNTFGQLSSPPSKPSNLLNTSLTTVPSFTLNIDPAVSVKSNGRVASVTVIAVCDEGSQLHIDVTLTQDSASGSGHGSGKCTGRLERYPVNVPAHGSDRFNDGAAEVSADAVIRDGNEVEDQSWTRAVNITIAP